MVRPQVFWFWVAISATFPFALYSFLTYLSRFQKPSTAELVRFLRGADLKRLFELFLTDGALRGLTSRRRFLQGERRRLHEAREIMRAVRYSMPVLMAWASSELHREAGFLKTGEGDEQTADLVDGHRQLLPAARDFHRYALLALFKINVWRVFCTHWWLPLPVPRIASLQKILGREFFLAYGHIFKAVAEVTGQYDDGFAEEVLAALFRIKDPEAMLALWRQSGMLKST
ncbi:MAG TPA: hypothetical protein VNW97_07525 [Candidatus Saccharimonadales bacterium]|jgi:hypothetical protein|nr:hypothetical protein [Candidatus Saccharimonadales bacterium]